jgi:hypothetical protein
MKGLTKPKGEKAEGEVFDRRGEREESKNREEPSGLRGMFLEVAG